MSKSNRLESQIVTLVTTDNRINGEKIDFSLDTFVTHPAYSELSEDETVLLNTKIFTNLIHWINYRYNYREEVYDVYAYNSKFGYHDCDANGPNGWQNAEESMKTTKYKFCLEDVPISKMHNIVKYFSKMGFCPMLCEYEESSYCSGGSFGYNFIFSEINLENDKFEIYSESYNPSVIHKLETNKKYAYVCLCFW